MKSIVVIGGGFAGLEFARQFKSSNYTVTLIDQTNHHLFQPLLYQVAGAQLAPSDIALPIREILKSNPNVRVLLEEVTEIDQTNKKILTKSHTTIDYDIVVLALGNNPRQPDPSWAPHVYTLKNVEDALKIREHILLAYEEAEWSGKAPHFVIVGGGPTGIELAGTLSEMAGSTLNQNFRHVKSEDTRISIVEYADRVLGPFSPASSQYTEKTLKEMGVNIICGARIQSISEKKIQLSTETLDADIIVWAAGTQNTPLAQKLNLPKLKDGRFAVDDHLRVQGCSDIYAIGDCAGALQNDKPLPSLAPVAKQQGHYLARLLASESTSFKPFRYIDKGNLATIGKRKAVGEAFGLSFKGFFAWWIWAVVHIYYLVSFSSKSLVLSRWIWNYLSGNRSSRLIHSKKI